MSTPTRLLALALSIGTFSLLTIPSVAARPMPMGPMHAPSRPLPWAPIPMLMPIVWHRAVTLRLTPSQENSLLKWRHDQMRKWSASRKKVMQDSLALREALLNGKPESALGAFVAAVQRDQARMLDVEIDQVEYLHRLLSPQQWRHLIALYRFQMMRMMHMGWHRGPGGR